MSSVSPKATEPRTWLHDHRYHKRLGTTTTQMEEYEVRDVGRRLESPDLHLDLRVRELFPSTSTVMLDPRIGNLSPEPALYATCRLYTDRALKVFSAPQHGLVQARRYRIVLAQPRCGSVSGPQVDARSYGTADRAHIFANSALTPVAIQHLVERRDESRRRRHECPRHD